MSIEKNLEAIVKKAVKEVLTDMGLADKLVDRQAPLEDHEQNVEKVEKKVAKKASKKVAKKKKEVEPEPEEEIVVEEPEVEVEVEVAEVEEDPFMDVSDDEGDDIDPEDFFNTLVEAVGDKKNKGVTGQTVAKACVDVAGTNRVKDVKKQDHMKEILSVLKLS